jgi:hypothetical protein
MILLKKYIPPLFCLIFLLFCSRNLSPFVYQTLYAEDGVWTANLLNNGFIYSVFNSRDFPVLGNIILLSLSLDIMNIFNISFSNYPRIIFFVSNYFFSLLPIFLVYSLPKRFDFFLAVALIYFLVFINIGLDGNEIFGRILNLGYLFPVFLAISFLKILHDEKTSMPYFFFHYIFIIISCLTFPVCFAISAVGEFFVAKKNKRSSYLVISFIFLLAFLSLSFQDFKSQGGAEYPFKADGLIDFTIARSIVFPLISPFYSYMNNFLSSLFFILFLYFSFFSFHILQKNKKFNLELNCLIFLNLSFYIYLLSLIILRSGFTNFFGDYNNTFPDRYFYGLNILFLILFFYMLNIFIQTYSKIKKVLYFLIFLWMTSYLTIFSNQFTFDKPHIFWNSIGELKDALCKKEDYVYEDDTHFVINIYPVIDPRKWTINLPKNILSNVDCNLDNKQ